MFESLSTRLQDVFRSLRGEARLTEPVIDAALDGQIEQLYHATMDSRPTGGDSRCRPESGWHRALAASVVPPGVKASIAAQNQAVELSGCYRSRIEGGHGDICHREINCSGGANRNYRQQRPRTYSSAEIISDAERINPCLLGHHGWDGEEEISGVGNF